VVDVPAAGLYRSLNGTSRTLAWIALAGLAVAGLLIIMLGSRLLRSRSRLTALNHDLDRLGRVDSLTGVRNRRDSEEALLGAVSAARRHETALAVLLIDIDHFKDINDRLGHQAGDAALIATAQTMQALLRTEDTIGRWGGEEFLVVLPHTDSEGALSIAERLRAEIAKPGQGDTDPRAALTVTIGIAVWSGGGVDDLISRADAALYNGKNQGRDNVQLAAAELDG
jgi:diguanylate cyclase (GGDEF)-like protein